MTASVQLLPHSTIAEESVLGSILRDNAVLSDVLQIVRGPDEFYHAAHRYVFEAALELYNAAKPIDMATVYEALRASQRLDDVGGSTKLVELLNASPTAANAVYYAATVHDKHILRCLIATATETLRQAYMPGSAAEELLEQTEKEIFRIGLDAQLGGTVTVGQVMPAVYEAIDRTDTPPGLAFGLTEVDSKLRMRPSEVTILAARPSVGKSALAVTAALNIALEQATSILFCSLEMSAQELVERMLCQVSKVDSYRLRFRKLQGNDTYALLNAGPTMRALTIHIDDKPCQSMLRISANARRLKLRDKIGLVIVDYLQLVEPENRRESRQEQVASVARRLKLLAKELNVPILALSQLNRNSEHHGGSPKLSDLRDSGAIEQDADNVILLHRPDDANRSVIEAAIEKQRNGPTGKTTLLFIEHLMKFEDSCTAHPFTQEEKARKDLN